MANTVKIPSANRLYVDNAITSLELEWCKLAKESVHSAGPDALEFYSEAYKLIAKLEEIRNYAGWLYGEYPNS